MILDFHEDYPLLVQSRSYVPIRLRRPAAAAVLLLEHVAARFAAGVISAEETGARRFAATPVAVVRNYMLESEVGLLTELDSTRGSATAVYVGTVNRERGLVEMVESVYRAGPDVELHLVGDISSELHDLVRSLDGGRQVCEHGRATARTCEILATASVGWCSGTRPRDVGGAVPVKLFEYMAAGLPSWPATSPRSAPSSDPGVQASWSTRSTPASRPASPLVDRSSGCGSPDGRRWASRCGRPLHLVEPGADIAGRVRTGDLRFRAAEGPCRRWPLNQWIGVRSIRTMSPVLLRGVAPSSWRRGCRITP